MIKILAALLLSTGSVPAQGATVEVGKVNAQVGGIIILQTANGEKKLDADCEVKFKEGQKVAFATDGNQQFVIDFETFQKMRADSADIEGALDALTVGNLVCQID